MATMTGSPPASPPWSGADLLVLMSDIDGLYTAPPHLDPDARFLETVDAITPEIEAMAGDAGSELSRGGMKTKIDAGKIATGAGCAMIIASGKADHPLSAIDRGARSSWFQPSGTPQSARKVWIAGQLEAGAGRLTIDAGLRREGAALRQEPAAGGCHSGRPRDPPATFTADGSRRGSVMPPGARSPVVSVPTRRRRGETAALPAASRPRIEAILGYAGRAAMIHRDDMVIG
jgi:glutamate 5-kinase